MKTKNQRGLSSLGRWVTAGWVGAATLSAVVATAAPRGADMKVKATVAEPEIIAVRVRHDMCPICRELDPKMAGFIRKANGPSVLWVTLDLSDETTQQQAALLVGAMGLQRVWTGDLSKMGSVTFLDGTSKRVLSIVQSVNTSEIDLALRKAIAASRTTP